jgi:hypothetical protein
MIWILLALWFIGLLPAASAYMSINEEDSLTLPVLTPNGQIFIFTVLWPLMVFIKAVYWAVYWRGTPK